jgi:hypothetical protein
MVAGSLMRLSFALGLLLAPEAMSVRRLAPDTRDDSFARMTTRAFGGVHINVALLTLRAAVLDRETRLALGLNLGCELADLTATLLAWRDSGRPDRNLIASMVLQSAGLATWTLALLNL